VKVLFMLFLMAPSLYANCRVTDVLMTLRPEASWSMTSNDYATLQWLDQVQTKPTRNEVLSAIQACRDAQEERILTLATLRATFRDQTKTAAERVNALVDYLELR
jgi:hypothetical protein